LNVGQARIAIRERGIAEILDLAFRFVLVIGKGSYLRLFLWVVVPTFGVIGLSAVRGVGWGYVWLLAVTLFLLAELPFTIAASRLLFSERVSLREIFGASLKLLPRYLGCLLLSILVLALSCLIPFLLPFAIGRILYLREIIILEGTGVGASWSRSQRFTQQRLWSALEAAAALAVLTLAFVILLQVLGSTLSSNLFDPEPIAELFEHGGSLFAVAGLLLAAPFVATARFLSYIDGRTRREAWDVQVRFMQLGVDERARRT
jgi:hypothetical protein